MTIQRYEVFNKVVELRNITKAGEELSMTQSGVSHAIKSLEEEFDIKLLIRNRLGLQLTSEGKKVHEYTLRIMNTHYSLHQEVETLKGLETGTIRVGSFASVSTQWMPKILNTFIESYEGINIEIYEDDYESLENAVNAGELDCCFTTASTDKKTEFIPLLKDKLYCIVSNKNSLAGQNAMKIKDFDKYPLIKPKKGWDNEVADFFNQFQIKPVVKYEISDDQSILALVAADHGINIRPALVMSTAPDNITPLNFEVDAHRIIGLAYNEWASPATSLFVKVVVDLFQEECFKHSSEN